MTAQGRPRPMTVDGHVEYFGMHTKPLDTDLLLAAVRLAMATLHAGMADNKEDREAYHRLVDIATELDRPGSIVEVEYDH